jgi:hypothetical protein
MKKKYWWIIGIVVFIILSCLIYGFTKKIFEGFGTYLIPDDPNATEKIPIILASDSIYVYSTKNISLPFKFYSKTGGNVTAELICPNNHLNDLNLISRTLNFKSREQKTFRITIPANYIKVNSTNCTLKIQNKTKQVTFIIK